MNRRSTLPSSFRRQPIQHVSNTAENYIWKPGCNNGRKVALRGKNCGKAITKNKDYRDDNANGKMQTTAASHFPA